MKLTSTVNLWLRVRRGTVQIVCWMLAMLLAAGGTGGCADSARGDLEELSTLRIGVLPDESPNRVESRHQPLATYLSEETGLPCDLVVPSSYADLTAKFSRREIDLAYFGGFTFITAQRTAGATPLVMRDRDVHLTAYFIVRGDSSAESLHDLRGKRLAFGSRLSTSGHVMPRHAMFTKDIDPEEFYSEVRFSGAHDATVDLVRKGEADVGAVNAAIIEEMLADGRLMDGDIQILEEIPPFPDNVWAHRPNLPVALQHALREAFLKLSAKNPRHRAILEREDAHYFVPAGRSDFARIEKIASSLGLLGEREP